MNGQAHHPMGECRLGAGNQGSVIGHAAHALKQTRYLSEFRIIAALTVDEAGNKITLTTSSTTAEVRYSDDDEDNKYRIRPEIWGFGIGSNPPIREAPTKQKTPQLNRGIAHELSKWWDQSPIGTAPQEPQTTWDPVSALTEQHLRSTGSWSQQNRQSNNCSRQGTRHRFHSTDVPQEYDPMIFGKTSGLNFRFPVGSPMTEKMKMIEEEERIAQEAAGMLEGFVPTDE